MSFELLHTVKSSLASAPSFSGWIYARLRRILLAVMAKLPGTCERAGVRVERVRSVARIRVRMNLCVCVPCVHALGDDTYIALPVSTCKKKNQPLKGNGNLSKKRANFSFWFAMVIHFSTRGFVNFLRRFFYSCLFGIMDSVEVVCLKSCVME